LQGFPGAPNLKQQLSLAPGTNFRLRGSTGIEFGVQLPIIQAPFRIYYAYNPTTVQQTLRSPIVLDPSTMPNAATVANAIGTYSPAYPDMEARHSFRFTIGRTF
jgi:outer membrane protein insertion porin family